MPPVSLQKKGRANKEPDFLISYKTTKGFKWAILEVDGFYHTPKRRAEEQERERDFERNGVRIYRFDSKKCYREPNKVVDEFLELLKIKINIYFIYFFLNKVQQNRLLTN
ncbi:DUF559 domain-containing protein [Okeania sp. KiyG1]|uniref:DUF559 domain-containing protein n=1 Tax=Okeania sp. KiyG1 TaxID=2720165 RepID=UPI001920B10D|nr:DUF559 domain-containing protein [Okeania sp. KiyG1]GGA17650.1 hypothetical protein CYANOKiyG1_31940 [Okeania sp. KiyG1]